MSHDGSPVEIRVLERNDGSEGVRCATDAFAVVFGLCVGESQFGQKVVTRIQKCLKPASLS